MPPLDTQNNPGSSNESLGIALHSSKKLVLISSFFIIAILVVISFASMPPLSFQKNTVLTVTPGSTLVEITSNAKKLHIVQSRIFLQSLVISLGGERGVQAGDYYFSKPLSVFAVAKMLATGNFNVDQVRITIPEGYSRAEISLVSQALLSNFNTNVFMEKTQNDEGYLFPDTYFVFPSITTENFIKLLKDNFDAKINSLREDIVASDRSEKDIIIMASIIEKEANGNEDRYVISGILWNRIDKGMPLQVDATFLYLLGKGSSSLTLEDLKTDSPYNTYLYKGLPPTPIGNPGIESIKAAIHPNVTPYFYYLHDKNGGIHYAKTFDEHKKNKQKYLN